MGENRPLPCYEIIVEGEIHPGWSAWFDELEIQPLPGGRVRICTCPPDMPALHGILERIRDLDLVLVSIQRVEE